MSKFDEKMQAHKLRRQGESLASISKKLKISKSSASVWCREINLTPEQAESLRMKSIRAGHQGRLLGAQKNRQKRIDEIEFFRNRARKEIGKLSQRDLTILVAGLFWAEGAKTGSRFMFVNSDPDMIFCVCRYLTEVENIPSQRLSISIQINRVHEKRIKKVLAFWSTFLGLPLNQFGKTYYVNVVPKKIYENHDSYYGIVRLGVRGGASLQYRLLGYIDALKSRE